MKITTAAELDDAILALEQRRSVQEKELGDQFKLILEGLRPSNLIKGAIEDIAGSPEIRDNVINSAIGIGTGLITKKLLIGKSSNIFKNILGGAIEFGVANIVAKKSDTIKAYGAALINRFVHRDHQPANSNDNR